MSFPKYKTGNGCYWLGRDGLDYLVKVDDGVTIDHKAVPMRFGSAQEAYDFCYSQYEQSNSMERHAYWNVCSDLGPYLEETA